MPRHLIHIDSHGLKAGFTFTAIPLITQLMCVKRIVTIDSVQCFCSQRDSGKIPYFQTHCIKVGLEPCPLRTRNQWKLISLHVDKEWNFIASEQKGWYN